MDMLSAPGLPRVTEEQCHDTVDIILTGSESDPGAQVPQMAQCGEDGSVI
jgi:hypothetical protein